MLAKLPFEELNAKMDSYSGRPPECCSLYVNIEACLAFVYDIVYDGHTFIELERQSHSRHVGFGVEQNIRCTQYRLSVLGSLFSSHI
jgi:hypothetical protein